MSDAPQNPPAIDAPALLSADRAVVPTHRMRSPGVLAAASLVVFVSVVVSISGCGMKVDTPLPDLANKRTSPGDQQPLSTAEQQRAIDGMIAKRDGKEPVTK